ncbi:hypothetical protein CRX72_23960 [Pantoea sp. BRM17]|nr:hypothetical protein CRX72_23960 [Pantoea sp. BRM17]
MRYEMPELSEEERQTLIGLCRIEVRRWKHAAEAVPDKRYMVELMEIALYALTENAVAAPAGWKLVPIEPTQNMIAAWRNDMSQSYAKEHSDKIGEDEIVFAHQAMLAAAPEAPCLSASSS